MKIGRSLDSLSITVDTDELAEMARNVRITDVKRLRVRGEYVSRTQQLRLIFSRDIGRVFRSVSNGRYWTVTLSPDATGTRQLETFGATPTTYDFVGGYVYEVQVPEVRAPLRRTKPVAEKKGLTFPSPPPKLFNGISTTPAPAAKAGYQPLPGVTDSELKECMQIFNRAIDRGFKPACDGRGRILYFDRQVGGE